MEDASTGLGFSPVNCDVAGCGFLCRGKDSLGLLAAHYNVTHPEWTACICYYPACFFGVPVPLLGDAGTLLRDHYADVHGSADDWMQRTKLPACGHRHLVGGTVDGSSDEMPSEWSAPAFDAEAHACRLPFHTAKFASQVLLFELEAAFLRRDRMQGAAAEAPLAGFKPGHFKRLGKHQTRDGVYQEMGDIALEYAGVRGPFPGWEAQTARNQWLARAPLGSRVESSPEQSVNASRSVN